MERLLQPLLKTDGQYRPISFDDAFRLVAERCGGMDEDGLLVMCSGEYSNEELYLIQRLARAGLRTNALGSYDYYRRGSAFFIDKNDSVPYSELFSAGHFFCIFDEQADGASQALAQRIVQSCKEMPCYRFNSEGTLHITNFGAFFRSLNHYLIRHDLAKGIYVEGLGKNYDTYKAAILAEDATPLLQANHLQEKDVADFIGLLLKANAPVFLVWERLLDARGIIELENLCMLLDIQAKPSTGFLSLKAEHNSQGLYDMGIFPDICVGGRPMDEESRQLLHDICQREVATRPVDIAARLARRDFQGCLYFNSTGAPLPDELLDQARHCAFSALHTAYWDGIATDFDLLLPAALPDEVHGTFTDSTRTPHTSAPAADSPLTFDNLQQISIIGTELGLAPLEDPKEIFLEYVSFFQGGCRSHLRHFFR